MPSLTRALLDHFLGMAGLRVLKAGQLILLANLFGPDRIGPYQAFILVVGLGQAVLPNPTATFLARAPEVREEDVGASLLGGLALGIVQAAIFALFLFLDLGPGVAARSDPDHLILGVVSLVAVSSIGLEGLWDRAQDFRTPKLFELVAILLGTGAALLVLQRPYALALGYAVTQVTRSVLILARLPGGIRLRTSRAAFGRQMAFSGPLVLAGWSGYIANQGDDVVVAHLLGAGALAFYTMAFYIPAMVGEITGLVVRPLVPAFQGARDRRELRSQFQGFNDLVALLSVTAGLGLFLMGDLVLPFLLGEDWVPAMPYLRVFAILFAVRAATGMGWSALAAVREKTRYLMLVSWATAGFMVLVGWPLIARWGLWGGVIYNGLQLSVMGPLVRLPVIREVLGDYRTLVGGVKILFLGAVAGLIGELGRTWISPWVGALVGMGGLGILLAPSVREAWESNPLFAWGGKKEREDGPSSPDTR